jgi:hypothetical protein
VNTSPIPGPSSSVSSLSSVCSSVSTPDEFKQTDAPPPPSNTCSKTTKHRQLATTET